MPDPVIRSPLNELRFPLAVYPLPETPATAPIMLLLMSMVEFAVGLLDEKLMPVQAGAV